LQVYQPGNVALFFDALDKIEVAARAGMRPMIHFDMHGSISKGLRRTRSTCKDRSSEGSINHFGFAVGTRLVGLELRNAERKKSGECQTDRQIAISGPCHESGGQ